MGSATVAYIASETTGRTGTRVFSGVNEGWWTVSYTNWGRFLYNIY